MGNHSHQQNIEKVQDEAIAWIAKLRSESVTKKDQVDFSKWLNADPLHKEIFDAQLDQFELLGALESKLAVQSDLESKKQKTGPRKFNFNFWTFLATPHPKWALPGSIAACITITIILFSSVFPQSSVQTSHYYSDIGQINKIDLNDGSSVTLNTNTSITVKYSNKQRDLTLHRGEAYFDVAKDPDRPFTVELGLGKVTAVGTAFNIRRHRKSSEITVSEGRVEVKQNITAVTPKAELRLVDAGSHVKLLSDAIDVNPSAAMTNALAWREQHIRFEKTPMSVVVDELNRYLRTPVVIQGSKVRSLSVTGGFYLDAPEDTLAAIAASFDLSLVQEQDKRILKMNDSEYGSLDYSSYRDFE